MEWTVEKENEVVKHMEQYVLAGYHIHEALKEVAAMIGIPHAKLSSRWNTKLRNQCSAQVLEYMNAKRKHHIMKGTFHEEVIMMQQSVSRIQLQLDKANKRLSRMKEMADRFKNIEKDDV
jgi:late competence protein required for DNA uptake (superfamily II DNA/RNA helicase)